jgi:RHS repeat-associated protein
LADYSAFEAAGQNLEPSADVSGDGVVDSTDWVMFTEFFGAPPDEVRIGYAGYVRGPLMEILLARHRWYDSRAGRWLTRDPAGYVDGLSLYLFVKGNPLGLVDPFGLAGRTPKPDNTVRRKLEWNHALPKDVFLDKTTNKPIFKGIDPNHRDFGRVMEMQDHRGGRYTGAPSNSTTHTEYTKHWHQWVKGEQDAGRKVTRQSVLAHLEQIETGKDDQYRQFRDWLGRGVKADHSYDQWGSQKFGARKQEEWYRGKVDKARNVAATHQREMRAARNPKEAASILARSARALKVIGFVGLGAAVAFESQAVYAGDKPWSAGVHDTLNPFFTVDDARGAIHFGNAALDLYVSNRRTKVNPHLSILNRNQHGAEPLDGEYRWDRPGWNGQR